MVSHLKDASPSVPAYVSWVQLTSSHSICSSSYEMEMLTESFQLWSHFPVMVVCKSIKSHLPDYLLTLSPPAQLWHMMLLPVTLDKTAWARNQCSYKNLKRSSFKSSLLKANLFFSNVDICAYRSDGCGTMKRHKHVFNCKYVLKSLSTQWDLKHVLIWAEVSIARSVKKAAEVVIQ